MPVCLMWLTGFPTQTLFGAEGEITKIFVLVLHLFPSHSSRTLVFKESQAHSYRLTDDSSPHAP